MVRCKIELTEGGRVCSGCKLWKPLDEFYSHSGGNSTGKTSSCTDCCNLSSKRYRSKLKKKVFDHYGVTCVCCGETERFFLTIDHVNNDGAEHKRKFNISDATSFYRWIIKNSFPVDLQTLCWNCNCGKRMNNGTCPHKEMTDVK